MTAAADYEEYDGGVVGETQVVATEPKVLTEGAAPAGSVPKEYDVPVFDEVEVLGATVNAKPAGTSGVSVPRMRKVTGMTPGADVTGHSGSSDGNAGAGAGAAVAGTGGLGGDDGSDWQVNNWAELRSTLANRAKGLKALEPGELERMRRQRARSAFVGGVADMSRALANLFYTDRYAPNMYDPGTSMSEQARKRYDSMIADRERDADMLANLQAQIAKIDDADRAWRYQVEQDRIKQEYQRIKNAQDAMLANLKLQVEQGKLTGQQYDNAMKEAKAKFAEENAQLENQIKNSEAKLKQKELEHVEKTGYKLGTKPARTGGSGGGGSRGGSRGGGGSSKSKNVTVAGQQVPQSVWNNSGFIDFLYTKAIDNLNADVGEGYGHGVGTLNVLDGLKTTAEKRTALMKYLNSTADYSKVDRQCVVNALYEAMDSYGIDIN